MVWEGIGEIHFEGYSIFFLHFFIIELLLESREPKESITYTGAVNANLFASS